MTTASVTVQVPMSLSRLIWRFLGRQPAGYLETVLEANPGVSDLGVVLPTGTVVVFPVDQVPEKVAAQKVVRLWD